MKSFELHAARALPRGACHWLNLGTLLCLSWTIAAAAPTVELLRDPWGTPHIFATTETDGFFGLGYAAAEDRLLQMELIRRKAAGRLAEVFGPDWVDADREARIAGHTAYAPRALAQLPERWQNALRAYAAGVNAWREAHRDAVARRFKPLGIQPEPWTPADCLLAARGILSLGSPFSAEPIEDYHRFQELVAQVGEAEAERQSGLVIDDSAAIVSEADMANDEAVYQRLKQRPRMPGFNLRPAGGGEEGRKMSHAWAVSGRKSTTGKPILESDPQLPLSSPPFFYEFHLAAGKIDARGLGIPGCPGLFFGWYPYDLGLATGGTGHTSRSLRLHELLRGDLKFSVEDFERVLHRDDVNQIVAILLPIARKVVEEDQVTDAAVLRLLEGVKGWDLRDGNADRFPAARGLGNTLTPYRGAGLNSTYGAGSGGVVNLARQIGERFAADGSTPTNKLVRA